MNNSESYQLYPQIITGCFTIIGAITIGILNYFTNKSVKSKEWEFSCRKEEISSRTKIYSDFLCEINTLILVSMKEKTGDTQKLSSMFNYYSQIELVSETKVIEKAKILCGYVLDCNTNFTNQQKHDKKEIQCAGSIFPATE